MEVNFSNEGEHVHHSKETRQPSYNKLKSALIVKVQKRLDF